MRHRVAVRVAVEHGARLPADGEENSWSTRVSGDQPASPTHRDRGLSSGGWCPVYSKRPQELFCTVVVV